MLQPVELTLYRSVYLRITVPQQITPPGTDDIYVLFPIYIIEMDAFSPVYNNRF